MAYASLTDISDRLGRPVIEADEVTQVNSWISDIEALVRSRLPRLDDLVDEDGGPTADVVRMVVANAVIRKIKNPDGKQNERIDDYSYGLTEEAARGALFLTEDEWTMLTPVVSTGAFSVRPFGEPDRVRLWASTTERLP